MNARELPHFREKAKIVVARKTVSAETNVEAKRAQLLEREWRMSEKGMAPRAVHNMEARCSLEQRKIIRRDLVQMRNDPALVDQVATFEDPRNRSSSPAIIHF